MTIHPWKPGQSGNPGGRPKGYHPFAPMLRRELAKVDRRNKSNMEKVVARVVAQAMKGDMDAVRWIADRVDGKVAQQVNVSGEQTIHVVPWLPAIATSLQEQGALPTGEGDALPEMEATAVDEVAEEAGDGGG